MNFGLGHGSRRPVLNVKCMTLGPNLPWRCKKGRIFVFFRLECRIFGGVTPKFIGCRMPNRYFGSRVTTRAELNEILQYLRAPRHYPEARPQQWQHDIQSLRSKRALLITIKDHDIGEHRLSADSPRNEGSNRKVRV
jgi:hypothetical protein